MWDDYIKEIKEVLPDLTQKEEDEIVSFMFIDGWEGKDTINHIKSVRDFNKRSNIE